MQITAAEASDILRYLQETGLWTEELTERLRTCVREYRLDVDLPRFGSRPNLRRTYTCPFFSAGPRGCSLPREVKPYGCLGFNPVKAGARGLEDGCRSDQGLVAEMAPPPVVKAPIPLAVLAAQEFR